MYKFLYKYINSFKTLINNRLNMFSKNITFLIQTKKPPTISTIGGLLYFLQKIKLLVMQKRLSI